MNLLDLAVKVSCKDEASGKIGGIADGIVGTMGKAAGIVSAVMGSAAVTGAVAIGKSALDAYASYEQLVGGVDTLFKESSATIQAYAADAYKTAGVSANTYMEQATNFSASLIQSLGGDTRKAAEYADLAIRDMSDNANKMGTSIESIQDTYQSLMRGNYAMLDNLKLGYGGTKAELERLVKDAEKLTGKALDPSKFSDVITAIHAVQDSLGITGTTALEAATTIEGSVNTMKAAWSNWLTGLGRTDADMEKLTEDLVDSVITAAENIVPRVQTILDRTVKVVRDKLPEVVDAARAWIRDQVPEEFRAAFDAATDTVSGAIDTVKGYFEELWGELSRNDTLKDLASTFGDLAAKAGDVAGKVGDFLGSLVPPPEAVVDGIEAIRDVLQWISDNGDGVASTIAGVGAAWATFTIVTTVSSALSAAKAALDGVTLSTLLFNAALNANPIVLVISLIAGLVAALVWYFTQTEEGRQKWDEFTKFLGDAFEGAKQLITTAVQTIQQKWDEFVAFVSGIPTAIESFFSGIPAWFSQLFEQVKQGIQQKWDEVVAFVASIPDRILGALGDLGSLLWGAGSSVIDGFLGGLKSAWDGVTGWFANATAQIPQLKGPLPVDLKLLTPNGLAIMDSLATGLRKGWPEVEDELGRITSDISSTRVVEVSAASGRDRGSSKVVQVFLNGDLVGDRWRQRMIDLLDDMYPIGVM